MLNPVVGFRFHPTDEEIIDHYLRVKNLGEGSSSVEKIISTVNICSFDPWDLPYQSKTETGDLVWYFFGCKDNKYNRGDKQSRKTSSGFWKKTGKTMEIIRKKGGNREKIGEKKVLVFLRSNEQSKTEWVMHEYHHAMFLSSSNQMTYTMCKVSFNGEAKEMNPYSSGEPSQSLIPRMNNYDGFKFTGVLDLDTLDKTFEDISVDDWTSFYKSYFGDDGDEQRNTIDLSSDGGPHLGQGNEINSDNFG